MGGLNNNAIGLKCNHTMVLSVDFVCGVCSTNQVHDEKDASCFDWGHIMSQYTDYHSVYHGNQSALLFFFSDFSVHALHIE